MSFFEDVASMGFIDWVQLSGLLGLLAFTYAIGLDAGWKKAAVNGGVGWLGFGFVAFMVTMYTIAGHAGR